MLIYKSGPVSYTANSVAEIDFATVTQEYALIDLDGTLAPALSMNLHQESVRNVRLSLGSQSLKGACIISNAGLWILSFRVKKIATICNLSYTACYWPRPRKPSLRAFDRGAGLIAPAGTERGNILVIGDQLNTDMAASKYGYATLLVPPQEPVPAWKRPKQEKEKKLRLQMGIYFPHELPRG